MTDEQRDPGELRDEPAAWPVESSEDLHRDGWVVALRADRIRRPGADDEAPFRRIVLEHPGAAVVLAVDDDDRVLCLRQYRHAARTRFVELPAGLLDVAGEPALEVARRELREEAAFEAERWTHLVTTYPSPGISSEKASIFLAEGLRATDRGDFVLQHEEADMEMLWVPFAELLDGVLAGRITDAPVVIAVLVLHARRVRGVTGEPEPTS
ncbi:NUDIX hydrolase [Nocardioides sp. ChNu-153]|uniref:NUDIX domain-containing protein n=1 Tax=unclassified Nocardioides TaxID=2615069 RepID=UPI002405E5E2|nr:MULTISPECIES: NUDIX hydrolase [unclassified Nocardioides]MDF9715216.1 NUDIX hydrolase [Nocardioides sp. ChNu-99]MDN7122573.1 NUDIX hydrolase [Nocardioides sp. ChNu-153]